MTTPKRNPDRVLRALARYLRAYPEQRVGQAISNNLPIPLKGDPYYAEDDDLATLLECSTPKPLKIPTPGVRGGRSSRSRTAARRGR